MTQNDFELDAYEQEILQYMDTQDPKKLKGIENEQEFIDELRKSVITKYSKKRPISLRPLEHDILLIQEKARREGIPYQTLLNSIIHKYATGQLVEK